MKKIALSALLVLSSAAFAGGRNASGPQNPPQPPSPEVKQATRLCADFYETKYLGLNRAEANLPENDTIVTVVPNTGAQVAANAFCVLMGPFALIEYFCHEARAKGLTCNNKNDPSWNRKDVP